MSGEMQKRQILENLGENTSTELRLGGWKVPGFTENHLHILVPFLLLIHRQLLPFKLRVRIRLDRTICCSDLILVLLNS